MGFSQRGDTQGSVPKPESSVSSSGAYSSLTPREQEIFRLLAEGLRPEQIATRLFISKKTAENHRFRLMQKLGFSSIAELVAYASELGVI